MHEGRARRVTILATDLRRLDAAERRLLGDAARILERLYARGR
jgi:hypothetical protein